MQSYCFFLLIKHDFCYYFRLFGRFIKNNIVIRNKNHNFALGFQNGAYSI